MLGTKVNFWLGDRQGRVKPPTQLKNTTIVYRDYYEVPQEEIVRDRVWLFENTEETSCGCWLWTGRVSEKGFPHWNKQRVHKVVWTIFGLGSTMGSVVQECPNKVCLNPNHYRIERKSN